MSGVISSGKKVFSVNKIGFPSGSFQTKLSQDSENALLLNKRIVRMVIDFRQKHYSIFFFSKLDRKDFDKFVETAFYVPR